MHKRVNGLMFLVESFSRLNDNTHKKVYWCKRSNQMDKNEREVESTPKKQGMNNEGDKGVQGKGWFNNKRLETQKTKSKVGKGRESN